MNSSTSGAAKRRKKKLLENEVKKCSKIQSFFKTSCVSSSAIPVESNVSENQVNKILLILVLIVYRLRVQVKLKVHPL